MMIQERLKEEWNPINPFGGLNAETSRSGPTLSSGEAAKIDETIEAVRLKYDQISLILQRLQWDRATFDLVLKLLQENTRYGPNGKGEIDESVGRLAGAYVHASSLAYDLDYEDLFVHGRILLDLMARLAYQLIRDRSLRWKSFTAQRKFFQSAVRNPYAADEDYASHVRSNTEWFEPIIRSYRDEFLVHNREYRSFGTLHPPSGSPRPIKRRDISEKDFAAVFTRLQLLKSKYAARIPKLDHVLENYYEIVDVLEANITQLDPEDAKELILLRNKVGAKMPDPEQVARYLRQFVEFYVGHFFPHSEEVKNRVK